MRSTKASQVPINHGYNRMLKKMLKDFFFVRCHIKYFISLYLNLRGSKSPFFMLNYYRFAA